MPKTEIYACEHKGCTFTSTNDSGPMWNVSVFVTHYGDTYNHARKTEMWCRECVERTGLLPAAVITPREAKEVKANPPTLEDIIRQMIQEEIEALQ
jgi:hypothetical protein